MRWGWKCPVAPVVLLAACLTTTDSLAEDKWSWANLVDELHYQDSPEPDWAAVLNNKIAKGLPLPDPTAESRVLSDKSAPDLQFHYWSSAWPWKKGWIPSPEARRKVLLAARKYPTSIYEVLDAFPTDEAALNEVEEILRGLPGAEDYQENSRRKVRAWLFRHGGRMREQVLQDCLHTDWEAVNRGRPDASIDALLTREPAEAERVLKDFTTDADPRRRVLAAGLLERRAAPEDKEAWRMRLIDIAVDPKCSDDAREQATEVLAKLEWPKKADWVVSRLRSPDCGEVHWFYPFIEADPSNWIPTLTKIIAGDERDARSRSAQLLMGSDFEGSLAQDALRPLLPWITDPSWADDMEWRTAFFQRLCGVNLPECTDLLFATLPREKDSESILCAARVLSLYQVKRAVPVMKEALARSDGFYDFNDIVRSIRRMEEFSHIEIVDGLVAYFTRFPEEGQQDEFRRGQVRKCKAAEVIGLSYAEKLPDDAGLVEMILHRARNERETNPKLAENLRRCVMLRAPAHAADLVAEGIAKKSIKPDELSAALMHCRDKAWNVHPFDKHRKLKGQAGAIVAVLTGDHPRVAALLAGKDQKIWTAVLEAASLAGEALDFKRVAELMELDDYEFRGAAKRYLMNRGEPEAQELWERSCASDNPESLEFWDPKRGRFGRAGFMAETLRQRFGFKGVPSEIIILNSMSNGSSGDMWHIVIGDENSFAVHDFGEGRMGVGLLDGNSVERVRKFLTTYQVDGLPSLEQPNIADGVIYGFTHATADGIRGFDIENPPSGRLDLSPSAEMGSPESFSRGIVIYGQLVDLITSTVESVDLKIHRGSEATILIPKETLESVTVWSRDENLRVLTGNGAAAKWLSVDPETGTIKGPAEEPAECPIVREFNDSSEVPKEYPESLKNHPRAGEGYLHPGRLDETNGIWLFQKGKPPELIAKGWFSGVFATPDGKWCVAAKTAEGKAWDVPNGVVRIDLTTKRMISVPLKNADNFDVITYLPAKGRFLLRRVRDYQPANGGASVGPEHSEYHLFDAASGTLERVNGDFRELDRRGFRPLQPASEPGCVWMARSFSSWVPGQPSNGTQIGLYDMNTFKFQKVREVTGDEFESMEMWVDEKKNTIHAAVDGDLIRLKLR